MDLEPKFLPVSPQHLSPLMPPPVPDNMNFQATVDDLIVLLLNNKKKISTKTIDYIKTIIETDIFRFEKCYINKYNDHFLTDNLSNFSR